MSEYEEYRQKYRLFDTALFLMTPDHWFRKKCKAILTSQMSEPTAKHLKDTEGQNVAKMILQYVAYFLR